MHQTIVQKADSWISRLLRRPDIDDNALTQKKIYWFASLAVTLMILCLTIAYHLIFPQLRILIFYGFFLSLIFLQGVVLPIFFHPGVSQVHQFIDQTLVSIVTLVCILKLGGIPYSGGLIFVGLALVFFSLNFWQKKFTLIIYLEYVVTVIVSGIMHPYLTVPSEMTPAVNISLYVVNLLWISGFAMVFVMNFISQRVRIEQLETSRIRELDEAKTKLYTNITHEFRTPLTVITGMMDLIRNDPEKWLKEGGEKIDRNSAILLKLVNQMLDLSKLEAGAMPLNMIRSDINAFIRFIVEMFESVASEKKIKMLYNPDLQNPVIDYDPDKLMQIVSNILSNALKFTQPFGRIEISTRLSIQGIYEISIRDNGPGIPENKLPFIFDRFYRIGEVDSHKTPGSGLGLALVRELIKLLNGTIQVESNPGVGTLFTISLPVTYNAQVQKITELNRINDQFSLWIPSKKLNVTPTPDKSQNGKPLLLIVEDNRDVIQYLETLLNEEYNIVSAVNGKEGILKAIRYVPEIIISDIMMPEMDGIEVLEKIKTDFRTSHIPVVMLTAKADIQSRIAGLEKGADAYLSKPFNREELFAQLRSLIKARKELQARYAEMGYPNFKEDKEFKLEDSFINRVRDIMNSNLNDENFNIPMLCNEIAMSRTQLYRKFKSLTNRTIAGYLRSLRLHKARELLMKSDITVSEAAYNTGFKNISHFDKMFKHEFGISPGFIRK